MFEFIIKILCIMVLSVGLGCLICSYIRFNKADKELDEIMANAFKKDAQHNVLYLCDGEKCEECKEYNADGCKYTTDIEHAKNFESCEMGYFKEKDHIETSFMEDMMEILKDTTQAQATYAIEYLQHRIEDIKLLEVPNKYRDMED